MTGSLLVIIVIRKQDGCKEVRVEPGEERSKERDKKWR